MNIKLVTSYTLFYTPVDVFGNKVPLNSMVNAFFQLKTPFGGIPTSPFLCIATLKKKIDKYHANKKCI